MNKFDEAIKELKVMEINHIQLTKERYSKLLSLDGLLKRRKEHYDVINKELERGKKLEELVKLYRYLNKKTNALNDFYQHVDDLQKQIEELESEIRT